jgi:hypothetical protein
MPVENRKRFYGTITDQYRTNLYGAKILLTDRAGTVIKDDNDDPIATTSDDSGKWGIRVPTKYFEYGDLYLTARYSGKEERLKITPDNLEVNFIIGAKTQEEEEVTVTACKTFKCKLKKSWEKNKTAYIIGIVSLVILAVILTIVLSTRRK